MATSESTLIDRLLAAKNPRDLLNWQKQEGHYVATCRATPDDVPGLIEMVLKWNDPDDETEWDDDNEERGLLPVTAWRTLGDLKAEAAIQPLIELLRELQQGDDWASEELPEVFGKIGEASIQSLSQVAKDRSYHRFNREIAVRSLQRVAHYHTDTHARIVVCLAELLAQAASEEIQFNTTVLVALVELQAVEAAEAIERAFAGDLVDTGWYGPWEEVRRILGVEGLGLKMPEKPYSSMAQVRLNMGIGVFSNAPLFGIGEVHEDAVKAYYQRADDTFSKSSEAKQFTEQFDTLHWYRIFLEFGIDYRHATVDTMTPKIVEEYLFEFVPRKVSAEPSAAAEIICELTLFWQYLDRVYKLPNAKPILDWLKSDALLVRLKEAMSDSSNFGMAKSIFMRGKIAGYDMTSQAGMNEYLRDYNASSAAGNPSRSLATGNARVGRNESCPCGSGKKFKKCCGRNH